MIKTQVRTHAPTGDRCIRLLINAEKRGAARVKKAQAFRTSKIKQARIEAEAEIQEIRDKKEAHIQEKLQQIKEEVQSEAQDYEESVQEILNQYEEAVRKHRDAVVEKLLEEVCNIQPVIHHNFMIQKEIAASGSFTKLHPLDEYRTNDKTSNNH